MEDPEGASGNREPEIMKGQETMKSAIIKIQLLKHRFIV
jgi:hypothetical protein